MGKSIIISSQSPSFIAKNIKSVCADLGIAENDMSDTLHIKQETKQSIGIEALKSLKSWSIIKPYHSENKIAFVENAELLTEDAQNSILKLLEEPNLTTTIILITTNHHYLLPTVISRCELIVDQASKVGIDIGDLFTRTKQEQLLLIRKLVDNRKKSKNETEIKDFLTNMMYYYRDKLLKNGNMEHIRFDINLIQTTNRMLEANVLSKLAMENLIINLK